MPALQALSIDACDHPYYIRKYIIGRDLVQRHKERFIIDFHGLNEADVPAQAPAIYQRLIDRVKPERDQSPRPAYRTRWWLYAKSRPAMRRALRGLRRYIVTPYTAKHLPFVFVQGDVLPDAMAYAVAPPGLVYGGDN